MDPSTGDNQDRSSSATPPLRQGASGGALFSWSLYDWANSAFSQVIQTFVFAAYFTAAVAADEAKGTSQWGYAIGAAGLLVALGGPVLGAVADQGGRRKPWIGAFMTVCIIATGLLWFVRPATEEASFVWLALPLVAIATIGFEYANIFYNAMLPSLAAPSRLGRWSGWAWALGYAGGLVCLAISLFVFVRGEAPLIPLDKSTAQHIRITFPFVSVWFLVFALPLFLFTPDQPRRRMPWGRAIVSGLHQLRGSLLHVRQYGHIVRFLIGRMLYIDGLATVFAFGGVYAAGTFNMSSDEVLKFGIALSASAGVGAACFAWVDDWIGSKRTIVLSLIGLLSTAVGLLLIESVALFWTIAIVLGIFVGPVQAASRSFLARTAPVHLRNEMFGLYAFSGKATSFLGPLLVGWLTALTGSQRIGMAAIIPLFLVGLALILTLPPVKPSDDATDQAPDSSSSQ